MSDKIVESFGLGDVKKEIDSLTAAIGTAIETINKHNEGISDMFGAILESYKKQKTLYL